MASQESDDDLLSGSDELLIDTGSSDDEQVDLEDITTEDEEPAGEATGGEDDEEEEEDDDWDSDDKEDEEEDGDGGPAAGPSHAAASDSSDGDMDCDRCPICLARLRDQDVGTPEGCDHSFCLECIQEWAKNVNTCPVDRQPFHLIFARNSLDGVVCRKIEVKDRRLELEEETVVDLTYCEVCGHATREDRLLLCDGCDLGYHCECLDPPLDSVPIGEWFCPNCKATMSIERNIREETYTPMPSETQLRAAQRRIGRTIVSERVRATIQQNRAQSASTSVRRGSTVRRRKKSKRRKQKRRSTSKGTSKLASSDGKKRVKRRRRKSRKTCRTKDSVTPKTVKSRLAGRLGIAKPPAGRTIPVKVPVKAPARSGTMTVQRDIGIAPLTIMAGRDDLDPDYSENDLAAAPRTSTSGGATVQMASARCILSSRYTKAAMNSWRPIPRPHIRKIPESHLQCTTPFDLLGDILAGQDRMNTVTERVKIHRDGSLEVKPENRSSRNQKRDREPNDTETTPTSGEGIDQRRPSGSGGTTGAVDHTQNDAAAPVSNDVDGGQCGVDGDCDGDECQSSGGATELVSSCTQDGTASSSKTAAEKKCDENDEKTLKTPLENKAVQRKFDENDKKTLKTAAENKVYESEEMGESDKDISDGSVISCDGEIDDDMMIHFDDDVDVDSDTAFNVDSHTAVNVGSDTAVKVGSATAINTGTAINTDTAVKVDSDIALNVDTTAADEEQAMSNDGSHVSDEDKQQPSDKENEGSPSRDPSGDETINETCVDQGVVAEESAKVSGKEDCGESDVEIPKAKRRSSVSVVGQLYSSDEGGSDQEKGESVHELAGSGEELNDDNESIDKEEMTGSVGSEKRTESPAVQSDNDEGVATATNEADETKPDSARYENISEVEDEEQTLEDGEESGEESEDGGTYDGPGSASMSHIMVPISELPRIPKKRNMEKVRLPTDTESPHSGVLERLNRPDKVDRYPKWEKRERKGEKDKRRRSESGGSDASVERPREERQERRESTGESRRRHRNRSRSSSREHSSHRYSNSKSTKHRHSHRRSRTPERDRSHRRRDRSHERSRDRTRVMSRVHARSRSRSPRYRGRDETRSSRDETRSTRDETRSSKRDRHERTGKSSRHKTDDDYKGSANIFSRSLKDAGKDEDFGGHRFKLQRNSFKEFTPSETVEPRKSDKTNKYGDKIDKYGDRYLSSGRKNVYMEDNRIKVKTSVDDIDDDSSGWSSDVIIIESDAEEKKRDARKTKKSKTSSDKPKVKSSVEKSSGAKLTEGTKSSKSSTKGRKARSRSPNKAIVKGKETRPRSPKTSEESQSRPRSPPRMAGEGRLIESSWSSVSGEARLTRSRSPDREPREQRLSRSRSPREERLLPSRSPVETRLARSPVPSETRLARSPDPLPSLSFPPDLTDSCYDPCHPTDSLSLSPPEDDPPQPTAPFPGDEVVHPSVLHMPMPMIPVDPRTVPPPNMIIPSMPPHMPFPMLAPGVRAPPPFLVNNHMMTMDHFPPRLNWQPIAAMQMMQQQARHLVPVAGNGIPMAAPLPQEAFVMPMQPREDLGAIFRPPLPPMPPASTRQSPGFKVPFPPKVAFSLTSGNHGDDKQDSESNEVVDMDVSSPLSDDLLESFSPPPFIDDDDSRGGTKRKDELPASAGEMDKQEKYLRKLNRQERVVEEVKLAIKPYYAKGRINKDEYKDIMRKAVPKICHSKSGNINPHKIRSYVEAYVTKMQQLRKYREKKPPRDNVNGHKRRHSRK